MNEQSPSFCSYNKLSITTAKFYFLGQCDCLVIGENDCNSHSSHHNHPTKYEINNMNKEKNRHEWFVLLDAASYVATNPLDLSVYPADFVAVSFYKMFGFPTGRF